LDDYAIAWTCRAAAKRWLRQHGVPLAATRRELLGVNLAAPCLHADLLSSLCVSVVLLRGMLRGYSRLCDSLALLPCFSQLLLPWLLQRFPAGISLCSSSSLPACFGVDAFVERGLGGLAEWRATVGRCPGGAAAGTASPLCALGVCLFLLAINSMVTVLPRGVLPSGTCGHAAVLCCGAADWTIMPVYGG